MTPTSACARPPSATRRRPGAAGPTRNCTRPFDDDFPVEEQLPRRLHVDFLERARGLQRAVILRCNDINFGDRITDNIRPDGYASTTFSISRTRCIWVVPVVRALMRTKRKSNAGDSTRRRTERERASSRRRCLRSSFSRAKQLKFFEGLDHVDLDLLKTVKEFVEGFEVRGRALVAVGDGHP